MKNYMDGILSLEEVRSLSDEDAWSLREMHLTLKYLKDQQQYFINAVVKQQMKLHKKELKLKASIECS